MRVKTAALVLHTVPYSENSLVARVFCRELGLRGYLVGRKDNAALFQPLNLLDMVVYETRSTGLHRIAEARFLPYGVPEINNPKKMLPLFLLREVLHKVIRDESPHPELFDFMAQALISYHKSPEPLPDFHLWFLLGFCRQAGFGVIEARELTDLSIEPTDQALSDYFDKLLNTPKPTTIAAHSGLRLKALEALLEFMRLHFPGLGELKSLPILKELAAML